MSRTNDGANIASALSEMAKAQPYAPAVYVPEGRGAAGKVRYSHYTYQQLDEASDRIARGLIRVGVGRGVRTALMVKPSLELFALVFALFKSGAVPVMIDPGIGRDQLGRCLDRARPEAFIGVPLAHLARLTFGWAKAHLRTLITVAPRAPLDLLPWGGYSLREVEELGRGGPKITAEADPADLAAILFTSGSTGPPKGVVYRHGNFRAQVEAIREAYGIRPQEIDLPTFPLFALFDPALGMSTVIPDMDPTRPAQADPRKIIEAIEDFGVTNLFGSPALLNTLSRYGEKEGVRLPTLKRVISAGAPVPWETLRRVRGMLGPEGQIHTPFGATESLPVATIESREVLEETAAGTREGRGVCVGRPVPSIELRVIGIEDGPIPEMSETRSCEPGEVGEIAVRGPQVTTHYFEAEEATAGAKIRDGEGFWHRMGDLGTLDEEGRLWYCGRKAHRVRVAPGSSSGSTSTGADRELYSAQVEGIFNAHPEVFRSALIATSADQKSGPAICVELEKGISPRSHARIREELKEMAQKSAIAAPIEAFYVHEGFPVDIRHNAKIGRAALGRWARSLGSDPGSDPGSR